MSLSEAEWRSSTTGCGCACPPHPPFLYLLHVSILLLSVPQGPAGSERHTEVWNSRREISVTQIGVGCLFLISQTRKTRRAKTQRKGIVLQRAYSFLFIILHLINFFSIRIESFQIQPVFNLDANLTNWSDFKGTFITQYSMSILVRLSQPLN